jgi:diacylglycerol kinase family enzyme
VVINPGAGKGQPVLKLLNDVCKAHGVEWDISLTRNYGDATEQARAALERGVDLVVGCGGDGTQHEIANAMLGSGKAMGVLPGGTGNGFATEMGIPKDFGEAVAVLCTSQNVRRVDVMQVRDQYCIQRLYAGIEPEQQVSREQKNKYGIMAYALMSRQQMQAETEAAISLTIDGQRIETPGYKCYVVNSGMGGSAGRAAHRRAVRRYHVFTLFVGAYAGQFCGGVFRGLAAAWPERDRSTVRQRHSGCAGGEPAAGAA